MKSDESLKGCRGRKFLPFILEISLGSLFSFGGIANSQVFSNGVVPLLQTRSQYSRPNLDNKIKRFARGLDLSEAQQSEVKKILEQQQREILKIRHDPTLTGGAGIDRVRALQGTTVARIRAVLNEEQKRKYDPLAPRKIPPTNQYTVDDWLKSTAPPDKGHE